VAAGEFSGKHIATQIPEIAALRLLTRCCQGRDLAVAFGKAVATIIRYLSTKADSLNFLMAMTQELARARPASIGNQNGSLSLSDDREGSFGLSQTSVMQMLLSLAGIGAVTAALLLLDQAVAFSLVPITYLIPVIVAATRWGIWPATVASISGAAAADFFFTTPHYSFWMDDPQEIVDLLLFLVVALASSNLASRLRRETETLRRREQEIQHLYEFSRRLAACFTISDLTAAIQNHLSRALERRAFFFAWQPDESFDLHESTGIPASVAEHIRSASARAGISADPIVDHATQNIWLLRAVRSETAVHGVVAINIGRGAGEAVDVMIGRIETVLEEVSLTLQRLDIGKALNEARLHLQAQLLRDAFHGTLSHELCSPLAAIQGSTSVLNSMAMVHNDTRIGSLVEAISDETAQLDGFIRNLLNATLVNSGGLSPRLMWADPRDIVNAAIERRARRLASHLIEVEFADDLPLVNVDSGLVEESFGQLLENAAKYSPSGSTISVTARAESEQIVLSVADQGAGITAEEQQMLGRRSYRSQRHQSTISGSGLGFWIASTFVNANGGAIAVSSLGRGLGTTVSVSLPASQMAVSETAMANE
jgi:K+-sensing histidine kinase KdpD